MTEQGRDEGSSRRAKGDAYDRLLTQFNAATKKPADCVQHLVSLGYDRSQARNAVYRYRLRHGLTAPAK